LEDVEVDDLNIGTFNPFNTADWLIAAGTFGATGDPDYDAMLVATGTFMAGVKALAVIGVVATVEQLFVAPSQLQIPLVAGFTLETPWSDPPVGYVTGVVGQSQDMQWRAHLAGQRVLPWLPVRSHATGLIDWMVRHVGGRFPLMANELIHPGRNARILSETGRVPDNLLSYSAGVGIGLLSGLLGVVQP